MSLPRSQTKYRQENTCIRLQAIRTFVLRLPIGENAFSFGMIFLGHDIDGEEQSDINVVKHEYGHSVHYQQIGMFAYIKHVAIPSLKGFWLGYDEINYYSQVQEYTADVLGNVIRTNPDGTLYRYSKEVQNKWWKYYWESHSIR